MKNSRSNLDTLVRLQADFDTANGQVINENGGRNRDALRRLSEVAGEMARIHTEEAAEMQRVADAAQDLAYGK